MCAGEIGTLGAVRDDLPNKSAAACLLAALLAMPPAAAATPEAGSPGAVDEVAALLAGTFDSNAQAEANPAGFSAVRIVAVTVPKSRLGAGSPVLYVEQAMSATPDKPYRVRFYRIEETADGGVVSRVFEPKEPVTVSGKWRDPSDLSLYGPGDVVERIGCAVRLKRTAEGWAGGTEGTNCPSARSGARYATTQARLSEGRMESWDRGYDLEDRQVWGAKEGPYVFERRSAGPPSEAPKPAVSKPDVSERAVPEPAVPKPPVSKPPVPKPVVPEPGIPKKD